MRNDTSSDSINSADATDFLPESPTNSVAACSICSESRCDDHFLESLWPRAVNELSDRIWSRHKQVIRFDTLPSPRPTNYPVMADDVLWVNSEDAGLMERLQ